MDRNFGTVHRYRHIFCLVAEGTDNESINSNRNNSKHVLHQEIWKGPGGCKCFLCAPSDGWWWLRLRVLHSAIWRLEASSRILQDGSPRRRPTTAALPLRTLSTSTHRPSFLALLLLVSAPWSLNWKLCSELNSETRNDRRVVDRSSPASAVSRSTTTSGRSSSRPVAASSGTASR